MGTRCNIAIVLEKEDLNKDIQFDWKKIKHPYNPNPEFAKFYTRKANPYIYPDLYTPPAIHTPKKKGSVLMTYCQYDGYPRGVGKTLLEDYNDYESALNLISAGCLETLVWVDVEKDNYYGGFQMSPERTNPLDMVISNHRDETQDTYFKELHVQSFHSLKEAARQQAYLYVWKDGGWWIARRCKKGETPDVGNEILRPLTTTNCSS